MAGARTADPITSHEAACDMERSGAAAAHRAICLEAVRRHPGQTGAEIAVAVGLERHEPSRRLPELREAGLIENREVRHCTVRGRRSMTWYPISTEVSA